ncbi:uncharacterized protein LOC131841472 [Achroia grisella]|uniref:uncharacterized protein LOC131841472 n=1 Tax=Achroia grisella TaxID=688607 RepID=UPI0027D203AC|nr:uncharacterized protein LOC131841472 [Achroia grisella]
MECQKCKKPLSKRGTHFHCNGQCQGIFHKTCVKGLAADLKAGRSRLFCNNCQDDDMDQECGDDEEEETTISSTVLRDINKKIEIIRDVKKQLETLTQTIEFLTEKYDHLRSEHQNTKEKVTKLEKQLTNINNKCTYLEKYNGALEQKILDLEQAGRKNNIQIYGVEQLPNENLKSLLQKLAEVMKVSADDIEWARRIPSRNSQKLPSILVGFKAGGAETRDNWLAKRRNNIELTSNNVARGSRRDKIYINEDLTREVRELLWKTKVELKSAYKFIWVSNGKILVKKDESAKSVRVKSESDLSELKEK